MCLRPVFCPFLPTAATLAHVPIACLENGGGHSEDALYGVSAPEHF
jgi:hypothetical protein